MWRIEQPSCRTTGLGVQHVACQVFNNMMRAPLQWPGISAPNGAAVMDGWEKSIKLGSLPMALFMNGHGYFVQVSE